MMTDPLPRRLLSVAAVLVAAPTAASAQVAGSCTLTVNTDGQLAMALNGTTLGSDIAGGSAATLQVVGVGIAPQLAFSAPGVIGPTGWSASPVALLSVSAMRGASQPFTAGGFAIMPAATDTLAVNARVLSAGGFKAGSYQVSTTVTCQAA